MAEHSESTELFLQDRSLISSTGANDPLKVEAAGGKSPGKSKKSKKVSLFKKSGSQDEGNFTRSSGRKRKSGREKKLEKHDSREIIEDNHQAEALAPSSPQVQHTEASHQYDLEIEQKSTIDLSIKKVQKQNKDLEKKNAHLAKSVDTLKKERDVLVGERLKLKSENKALEKELKKVTRKSSQPTFEEVPTVDADVLREKIQTLEEKLTEKDRTATLLKLRLDNMDISECSGLEELDKSSNSMHTKNGARVDPTTALEMLVEEHETSMKLRRENDSLKSRLMGMEAELEAYSKGQREWANPSPKSPRKKSTGLFKRGKKNTSSMKHAHDEVRQDFLRSQSPDVLVKSESNDQLEVSVSPLMPHTNNKESSVSLPPYYSPNHSPHLPTKNRMDAEILTLQSCLKLAIEEKTVYNEDKLQLEKELDGTKSKIIELEETIATTAESTKTEIEKLKSDLKSAEIERDTYCEELKIIQSETDELTEKMDKLTTEKVKMDETHKKSLGEKDKRIEELEQELATLKKSKVTSPSHSKPPVYGSITPSLKTSRERLVSPPYQGKAAESARSNTDKSSGQEKHRERLTSTDLSPKHEKPSRLTRERSQEKLGKAVPPSPTRKVGRLSRESSIDRFEIPQEVTRKISSSGVSSPSLSRSPKVAATRAMFEQKIDETNVSNTKRQLAKSSLIEHRRSSFSVEGSVVDSKEKVQPHHSKSYSIDSSTKHISTQRESSTGNTAKAKVVPPTAVAEQVNEPGKDGNEAKNKLQEQKQDKTTSIATAAIKKPTTILPKTESLTKVSRITVKCVASPTNSPILSNRKEIDTPSDQPISFIARAPTSPSSAKMSNQFTASRSQASATTKVSTVSTTVRHSNPTRAAEMSSPSPKTHSAIVKSHTESKLQAPSTRGKVWSSSSQGSQVTTTTTTSSVSTPNRVIVKTSSRLGDNLMSPVNKAGSLQNLPLQVEGTNSKSISPQSQETTIESPAKAPTPTVTTSSVVRRGPTHKALQRRERKDRPKTMYAGRAETTNLVNLISKFQEEEKEKKLKESAVAQAPNGSNPSKVNGTSVPSTPGPVPSSPAAQTSGIPSSTVLHQQSAVSRPSAFHNSNNISNSTNRPGINFHQSASFTNVTKSKPLPHERILQRSRTVASGLGSAKLSKRGMLLKWCQIMTEDYENVNISNFAESFSNGLAFCALMHHFLPDQIPFNQLDPKNRENNFRLAFQTAENAGIPSLLDVEDMVSLPIPDWMSVMTYVSFIYNKFGQQSPQQPSSLV